MNFNNLTSFLYNPPPCIWFPFKVNGHRLIVPVFILIHSSIYTSSCHRVAHSFISYQLMRRVNTEYQKLAWEYIPVGRGYVKKSLPSPYFSHANFHHNHDQSDHMGILWALTSLLHANICVRVTNIIRGRGGPGGGGWYRAWGGWLIPLPLL